MCNASLIPVSLPTFLRLPFAVCCMIRSTSRSANGRHAAWLGWEEEKRALEETISELNMRLASKDHDIAELHIQLEERERDLRVMHGGVSFCIATANYVCAAVVTWPVK